MKHYALVLLATTLVTQLTYNTTSYAQEIYCAQQSIGSSSISTTDTIRALIAFVRFNDDNDSSRDWPVGLTSPPSFSSNLLSPTTTPVANTLTGYYHQQSLGNLTLYGDVHDEVIVTDNGEWSYYHIDENGNPQASGFATLTTEIVQKIDDDVDFSEYDDNDDGVVDYLFVILRANPEGGPGSNNPFADVTFSGVSNLATGSGTISDSFSFPSSLTTNDGVSIDWDLGSYIFNDRAGNVIPLLYYVPLMAHEFGHDLWTSSVLGGNHLQAIGSDGVPTGVAVCDNGCGDPTNRIGYALMPGSQGAESMAGSKTISAFERDLLDPDWINCSDLENTQYDLQVTDLYTTGACYKIELDGASGKFVYVSNRQRDGYFDDLYTAEGADIGLKATGLQVGFRSFNAYQDLPPDNTFNKSNDASKYDGDMYSPSAYRQITPWTRPGINGRNDHPIGTPSWQAIDNIRYVSGNSGPMLFDYIEDFRISPTFRNDSWIGEESSGEYLQGNIVVEDGATLTITTDLEFTPSNTLTINGTLNTEDATLSGNSWGGIFFSGGSTATIDGGTISGDVTAALGSNVTIKNTPDIEGNLTVETLVTLHIVQGDLVIPANKTLDIGYGATLVFDPGYSLEVYGTLNADGVTFTSSGSDWNGIQFYGSGGGSIYNSSIENLDDTNGSLLIASGSLDIADTFIEGTFQVNGSATTSGTLSFGQNGILQVSGSLDASNTTFQSSSAWNGIYVSSGGDASINGGSIQGPVSVDDGGELSISGGNHSIDLDMYIDGYAYLDETTLSFDSGDGIVVNGTLDADDTDFEGSGWEGIYFNSGSDGTIMGGSIDEVSATAIDIYNASPTIHGVSIDAPYTAIYVNGSSAAPLIRNTDISAGGPYIYFASGIYFSGDSYGLLYENNIDVSVEASGNAVGAAYFAYVKMRGYPTIGGENTLKSNDAISASYSAWVDAGSMPFGGVNHFCGSDYHINAYQSTVHAPGNYWPGGSVDSSKVYAANSTIELQPSAGSASCSSSAAFAAAPSQGEGIYSPTAYAPPTSESPIASSPREKLQRAHALMVQSEAPDALASIQDEAIRLLKEIAAEAPDAPEASAALVGLWKIEKRGKAQKHRTYFEQLAARQGPLQPTALGLLIAAYQFWGDNAAAEATAHLLAENYADTWHGFYAQLSLFWMHLAAKRYEEAEQVLKRIVPHDEQEAEILAQEQGRLEARINKQIPVSPAPQSDKPETQEVRATGTQLVTTEVYPNPFNPVTTIRYHLPAESRVVLRVYDMLGREVMPLVNAVQGAGTHEVPFDASNLASGLYQYRLEVDGQIQSGTMLLFK